MNKLLKSLPLGAEPILTINQAKKQLFSRHLNYKYIGTVLLHHVIFEVVSTEVTITDLAI